MPDKPAAEIVIDEPLIRGLLREQAPGLAREPLRHVADGWDCSVWRVGERFAVRMPRRALGAQLVLHEQQHLGAISARLAPLRIPDPVVAGRPSAAYPWHWSIVPWADGTPGLSVARSDRGGWAVPLARALRRLHVVAKGEFPVNPYRGVPLRERDAAIRARLRQAEVFLGVGTARSLSAVWQAGVAAVAWTSGPVRIHGDLHPGNLIADGSALVSIIDFGDLTAGDPAYDLAVAWLAFDARGRAAFQAELQGVYDAPTWMRARAWAAAVALMLVLQSDDDPDYRRLGREVVAELVPESSPH
ncbi:aminoglycoside phosphotransferase family protein [Microbacterium gilvum]|uniref:Aminoglycoside phosphotransferase family protein n=1 Tax=Microbacterium gilvum TaxID=1336204 RepID=A0ABP8ZUC1_9MICO